MAALLTVPRRIRLPRGPGARPDPRITVSVLPDTPWAEPFDFFSRRAEQARRVLGGRNLGCWCPLDDPDCHADVLLQIVNRPVWWVCRRCDRTGLCGCPLDPEAVAQVLADNEREAIRVAAVALLAVNEVWS